MNVIPTICAVATAPGGALGIIRVSGPDAITFTDKIFRPAGKADKPLSERKANTLTFGTIVDGSDKVVDEVLVSLFRAPHSYTGEDSTEISCHGSAYILQQVLELLIGVGCRMADPGEYTKRAFMNGKMDLAQAEAVADLIAATTAANHRMAMQQMRGGFSGELAKLRSQLLHLTSLMELELDFSDHEELEFADRSELRTLAVKVQTTIKLLASSFHMGNAIKNGIPVTIAGETNAGKSTLLNRLLGEERAIVSNIHGTTRDVIEDVVNINGTPFRFIDTAGLRDTSDEIEAIGISRTMEKISQSDIVILLIDATCANAQLKQLESKVMPLCTDKHVIVVFNKIDSDLNSNEDSSAHLIYTAASDGDISPQTIVIQSKNYPTIYISALCGTGIENLLNKLCEVARPLTTYSEGGTIVSNVRHTEALNEALEDITRVLEGLDNSIPTDLISQDLRECLTHLGQITGGTIQTPEVLTNIFQHFCIGK